MRRCSFSSSVFARLLDGVSVDVSRYQEVLSLTEEEDWSWVSVALDPMTSASLSASSSHHPRGSLP